MSPMLCEMLVNDVVPRLRHAAGTIPKVGHEDDEEIVRENRSGKSGFDARSDSFLFKNRLIGESSLMLLLWFARNQWVEKVEARGVEPLSETPSVMVSTRLASGLKFRVRSARLRRCQP